MTKIINVNEWGAEISDCPLCGIVLTKCSGIGPVCMTRTCPVSDDALYWRKDVDGKSNYTGHTYKPEPRPVVFITAHCSPDMVQRLRDAAKDYLRTTEPFNPLLSGRGEDREWEARRMLVSALDDMVNIK